MAPDGGLEMERLRCAAFRSSTGADPIGTAAHHRAFLCVTVPLPWDRDISSSVPFSSLGGTPVLDGADGRTWRAQGLVPADGDEGAATVLACVAASADDGAVGPFARREWRVHPGRVTALCRAVLDDDERVLAAFEPDRREVPDTLVDVLVCGHGRRDACCGSAGAALAEQFRSRAPEADAGVRVWRTSHTGGHRFAATALTFPDGYAWAHLGPSDLEGLTRGRPVPLGSCRGWSAASAGPAQVADREGRSLVGDAWARSRRRFEVTAHDRRTLTTTVRVTADLGDRTAALDVEVRLADHLPQPTCGRIDEPEYVTEPVWAVTGVRVLDG